MRMRFIGQTSLNSIPNFTRRIICFLTSCDLESKLRSPRLVSARMYEKVEFSSICRLTKFGPKWFINVQMHADVFDAVNKTAIVPLDYINLTHK